MSPGKANLELCNFVSWATAKIGAAGWDNALMSSPNAEFLESELLRELAWVILCSGFRERVVRRIFPKISLCFFNWASAEQIAKNAQISVVTALDVFNSKPKIGAIARSARMIDALGFQVWRERIAKDPITAVQAFPFVGKITAFHLAKNLGFDVAKPDRHLQRLSMWHGYASTQEFCGIIARATGESVRNIDTLLWRLSEMGLEEMIRFKSVKLAKRVHHAI